MSTYSHKFVDLMKAIAVRLAGEPALLASVHAAANAIQDKASRVEVLMTLAGLEAGEERVQSLSEALATARVAMYGKPHAECLALVAAQLAGPLSRKVLSEALAAARAPHFEDHRVTGLAAVAAQLPSDERRQVLREALATACDFDSEGDRARQLAALAPHLANERELLGEALCAARDLDHDGIRHDVLLALAPQLSGKTALLAIALEEACAFRSEGLRASALAAVAAQLKEEPALLSEALSAACVLDDERDRANALESVKRAARETGDPVVLRGATRATRSIDYEKLLTSDLERARGLDSEIRASALVAVAVQLSDEKKRQVLGEALALVKALDQEHARAFALIRVVEQMDGDPTLLRGALEAVRTIDDSNHRGSVIVALAGHLADSPGLLREALTVARQIKDEGARAGPLAAVTVQLATQEAGEQRRHVLAEVLREIETALVAFANRPITRFASAEDQQTPDDVADSFASWRRRIAERELTLDWVEPEYAVVRVFFGTDRNLTGRDKPTKKFGLERADLSYGSCEVSIPRDHRMGDLEAPSIWRLDFRDDPTKHIVLLKTVVSSKEQTFTELAARVQKSVKSSAFLFVHGYNATFQDAARRTAQMSYDLGFDGAPVFYSWPSQGAVASYTIDEANIEWAQANLKSFLNDLLEHSKVENLYLIAHSMGNRALTRAVASLLMEKPALGQRITEVILTAPDIDAEVFKRDIVPPLTDAARPITLYASSEDLALVASKKIHGYPRAGESGPKLVITAGIETIDASNVDTSLLGHSYFADSRSVLSDVFQLIRHGQRANQRFGLREIHAGEGRYWMFKR